MAVCGAVSMVACAGNGSEASRGPLNAGGTDRGTVCVPSTANGTVTMGGEVLTNTGRANVVIDKVTLADPNGLALVESVVLPVAGNTIGYAGTYPPSSRALTQPGLDWSQRKPAAGATVAPGADTTNLVTAIRLTGGSGSTISGIAISYHVSNGDSYQVRTPIGLVVKISPATC